MSSYKVRETFGNTKWFTHDRFGMFIHFGLYSLPARHEWVKKNEYISEEKYQKYFDNFNPDLCDPKEWARSAKKAGMKYAILTTKHHEGFCLFDSKFTDYKSTNTPFGKDIVREYVDAFRAEGLKIGFYYSLLDWHHPEFPIDLLHPRRNDRDAKELDKNRDMKKYAEYMRNQVTELLTNYGKIDILWFDFSYPHHSTEALKDNAWMQFGGGKTAEQWETEKLIKLIRELQPEIILNNRAGIDQDLWTPEQFQATEWFKHPKTNELVTWESCQTFSGSWGYYREETSWKSPEMLIKMLIKTVACGGNLIMNVGPTGRGNFDYRAEEALQKYADWMRFNGRSIYGCTMAEPEFVAPQGTVLTQSENGKRLYIHLIDYPFLRLEFKNLADKIEYANFLSDASEVLYTLNQASNDCEGGEVKAENSVFFQMPTVKPNDIVPVIEVILK